VGGGEGLKVKNIICVGFSFNGIPLPLNALLWGCETWTLTRRNLDRLKISTMEQFEEYLESDGTKSEKNPSRTKKSIQKSA
jgi:hypothetical protein